MPTQPARRDLIARRNVPFGLTWQFKHDDDTPLDLTGYSGTMQIRLYEGADGSALVSLTNQTTDIEGVRVIAAEGLVQVLIDEATLAALPGLNQPEAGSSQIFKYDLVLTDGGGVAGVWLFGDFTLRPGVTD